MDVFKRQEKGKLAEEEACRFLIAQGLQLVEQNYRCNLGEIDLIMRETEDIVFVEVRSRGRLDYGQAAESINNQKKSKLVKTATHFLQQKKWLDKVNSRFDVVSIHFLGKEKRLDWFKNAFWLE